MALDLTVLPETRLFHTDLRDTARAPARAPGRTAATAPAAGHGPGHAPGALAAPGALRQVVCAVALAPRVVTVLPGRDDLRAILDKDETDLVEIRIRTTLALTAEDRATIAARGSDCPMQAAATLRIPRRLAWQVPCARETLRMTIRPDAVLDCAGLTLDARVTALSCLA